MCKRSDKLLKVGRLMDIKDVYYQQKVKGRVCRKSICKEFVSSADLVFWKLLFATERDMLRFNRFVRTHKCMEDTLEFRWFQLQTEMFSSKHACSTDMASRDFSFESDFLFLSENGREIYFLVPAKLQYLGYPGHKWWLYLPIVLTADNVKRQLKYYLVILEKTIS